MTTRVFLALGLAAVAASCSRDLTLPVEPGAGALAGRVLLARPGQVEKVPLAGVEVNLLGSGLTAVTNAGGTFELSDFEASSGLVLFRVTVAGEVRQRLLEVADYGTGPKRRVNVGDIVLGASASVRGKVLRGDISAKGGHGGTTIFVPAGPFTGYTNDDGSFVVERMPEGPLELYAFRQGYAPLTLGSINLRAGEVVTLADFNLSVAPNQTPGSMSAKLAFRPEAAGAGDAQVRLVDESTGAVVTATVSEALEVNAPDVPVGLYRLIATRSGYSQLDVVNVLIVASTEAKVGTLTLTTAPYFDAGTPPRYDPDAGRIDAGETPPDSGVIDAGTGLCSSQAECQMGRWCDPKVARCVPLCANDVDCGFGRVCQQSTKTCVTSCAGMCGAGQVCNAQNICQSVCDGAFPCPSGQKCAAGMCVPECSVNADCQSPFLGCDFGVCRRNTFCNNDFDCTREQVCVLNQCAQRPTDAGFAPDGGGWADGGLLFTCNSPCQCKSGERCSSGFCLPDVVPTRFVALDGGGDGKTPDSPSGDLFTSAFDGGAAAVALLANETWDMGAKSLRVGDGVSLNGGFTRCGTGRWVRDQSSRTILTGTGTAGLSGVIDVATTLSEPINSLGLSQLNVRLTGGAVCGRGAITLRVGSGGQRLNGVKIEDVNGDMSIACSGNAQLNPFISMSSVRLAEVRRVRLDSFVSTNGLAPASVISATSSSGTFEDISSGTVTAGYTSSVALNFDNPPEPLVFRRIDFGQWSTQNNQIWHGIEIQGCGGNPLLIEDSKVVYDLPTSGASAEGVPIYVEGCKNSTLRRLLVSSDGSIQSLHQSTAGIKLVDSQGVLQDSVIIVPTSAVNIAANVGLWLEGTEMSWSVDRVQIVGKPGQVSGSGGYLTGQGGIGVLAWNASLGVTRITNVSVSLSGSPGLNGLLMANLNPAVDIAVTDSQFDVSGIGSINEVRAAAVNLASVKLERLSLSAANAVVVTGVRITNGATVELYGSSIRALASNGNSSLVPVNNPYGSIGVLLESAGSPPTLRAIGNTIDPVGVPVQASTVGMWCRDTPTLQLFQSNIVTAGQGTDSRFIAQLNPFSGTGCYAAANYKNNYFFGYTGGPVSPSEKLFDAGILTTGVSNTFGNTQGCFLSAASLPDGGTGFPHYLAPGSPCVDTGAIGTRINGTLVGVDRFGKTRDGGLGPDVGAVEL